MNVTQLRQGSLNGLRRQTNECLENAYNKGYKVGYNEEIAKQKDPNFVPLQKCPTQLEDCKAYKLGLEDGYKGYKYLEKWFADTCFYDDEDNLFPEYKRRQADICCLEDIITDVGFSEVLNRVKAYEEKKNGEIKVGDEVVVTSVGFKGIVLSIYSDERYRVIYKDGIISNEEKNTLKRTGRHFDEVGQLLDKLRGEEE